MDKLNKYLGIIIFSVVVGLLCYVGFLQIVPQVVEKERLQTNIVKQENLLKEKKQQLRIVQDKIKKINESIAGSQKKVYFPVESDLGSDTLFFTLYNDVIEMLHANSIKIKSIDYKYNPEGDKFVEHGKDKYFVCDVNLELVSNYVNLGKFIEEVYQYPYYIKINSVAVESYKSDKKILLTKLSLRLYAHTEPDTEDAN